MTVSPLDPQSWTAFQLDEKLQSRRYDLVFLAGHFAADNALAADFPTALLPTDILSSTVDMRNALFYSMGCHSGYNVVNEHRIPNVTSELDWASAFAEKGVTWIGGTGFQYGDTEFIEYSERLYLDFTRNLRYEDPGDPPGAPVAIGKALVRAEAALSGADAGDQGDPREVAADSDDLWAADVQHRLPGRLVDAGGAPVALHQHSRRS